MNSRKIIIVAIVILVLVILSFGLYFLFGPRLNSPATQTGQTGTLPATGNQQGTTGTSGTGLGGTTTGSQTAAAAVTLVSDSPTLDYFATKAGAVLAVQTDGEIIEMMNGQVTTLSSLQMQNIINASFSYDGAKVLVTFGDPSKPQTSVFDVASKAWAPMATGWESPVWSPVDYRIAYIITNANGTESFVTFDVSKLKGSPVVLTTLHTEDMSLAWASKSQLIISTKPSAYLPGSSWLWNIQNQTLTSIAKGISGLDVTWSGTALTTETGLLFSAGSSGIGGALQLVTPSGNALQSLTFVTLPTKCAFATQTSTIASVTTSSIQQATSTAYLYCGVPRDQDTLSISRLPDDYDQMALYTSDDVYQINLGTGAINTVFNDQTQNFDISNAQVFNNALYFVNRYDEKLYSIQL